MTTNLAAQIRKARLTLSLKQSQVADAVGVSTVTISRWEHSHKLPSEFHLHQLSKVLQLPIEALLILRHQILFPISPFPSNSIDIVNNLHLIFPGSNLEASYKSIESLQKHIILPKGIHILTISTSQPVKITIDHVNLEEHL